MTVALAAGRTSPWTRLAEVEATDLPGDVVEAFREVLKVLCGPSVPEKPGLALTEACQRGAARLSEAGEIQLASVVGALLHELRHVHDFTGSMTGAVSALLGGRAAGDAEILVDHLARWTTADPERVVQTPLTAEWLHQTFPGEPHAQRFTAVIDELDRLRRMWTVERNAERIVPGISISGLYEASAYLVQMELTAALFNPQIAAAVHEATERPDVHPSLTRYAYATRVFAQLVGEGAELADLAVLLGLVVDEIVPPDPLPKGSRLPSAERFFDAEGPVPLLLDAIHDLRRRAAAGEVVAGLAGPVVDALLADRGAPHLEQRYLDRRQQLDDLLKGSTTSLLSQAGPTTQAGTVALVAAEVPVAYGELFRTRTTPEVDLFSAQEWAGRTLLGELAPATVRVRFTGGSAEVFHSRSLTPSGPDLPTLADRMAARWKALTTPTSLAERPEVSQARQRMARGASDDEPRIRPVQGRHHL